MNRRAFTLVELLVALAVVAMVVALAMPALGRARQDSRNDTCVKTLRAIMQASVVYAADGKGALPHGMNSPWAKNTTIGASYYVQVTHGPKQIVGVGQLMWSKYLPEKREAIGCPQTDEREEKGFNTNTWMPIVNYTSRVPNDVAHINLGIGLDPAHPRYYRNVYGAPEFPQYAACYAIRGPAMKIDDKIRRTAHPESDIVKPADLAFFADHEAADQKLIAVVDAKPSPVEGWGRVHLPGFNVGYLDGHVALVADEDRSKTWAGGQNRYYGNSSAMEIYDADYKPGAK